MDATAAMVIVDPAGAIEWANAGFERAAGVRLAECRGRQLAEILVGRGTDRATADAIRRALRDGRGFNVDVPGPHEPGQETALTLAVDPVSDAMGRLQCFVGAQTDTGARRRVEQSLRMALSQLTATLESTTDGILVTDLGKNVVRFNHRFKDMWQVPDDLAARTDDSVLRFLASRMESPDSAVAMLEALYASPETDSFATFRLSDGRTFERNSRPQYVDGLVAGRVCSFRDITGRVQTEIVQTTLYRISEAAHTSVDMPALFLQIHRIIGDLLPARNFFVALYDADKDELTFPYFVDEMDPPPGPKKLDSGTLSGEVVRTGQARLISSAGAPGTCPPGLGSTPLDWLGVPLVVDQKAIGALVVQSYSGTVRYTERDKTLLEFVSSQVATAVLRKRNEEALRDSEERHRLLADNAADVIWTLDNAGRRTYISPSITRLRGYSVDEIMKSPVPEAFTPESCEIYAGHLEAVRRGERGPEHRIELEQPCKDGSTVWVEVTITRMTNARGEPCGFLGVSRDISERKRQATRIESLAFYDELTQLPNRALFLDRLDQALGGAERRGGRLALMFLGLDRFKEINDSLGHGMGDAALREVAARLKARTRQEETLARLGGDEFVLIAYETGQDEAAAIAQRMLQALHDPIAMADSSVTVQGSVGIALYPEDGVGAEELIRHADIAMYRAKAEGGGFRFYRSEMGVSLERRVRLASRMLSALERGEFQLHYQPHFCLRSGQLAGAEALLRWHDEEEGWISPGEFIPIAEDHGLMGHLGSWVMQVACRQLKAWDDAGLALPGRLAVNVSARQLHEPDVVARLRGAVLDAGLRLERIELEITESSMMEKPEAAGAIVEALSQAGFSLAIDDFGTGYSSLSYLKRFSVDTLKIDISFVRDMLVNKDDHAIVKAIIAMADSLGLRTTAEGVEAEAQARALAELGCQMAQGYHFGRPLPGDAFSEQWLAPARAVDV